MSMRYLKEDMARRVVTATVPPVPDGPKDAPEFNAYRRSMWTPSYDTHLVEVTGQDWPVEILVERWETNTIGERRYVETRSYRPVGEKLDEARQDDGRHEFVGRLDRWCEVCNLPDRNPVHWVEQARQTDEDGHELGGEA